MRGTGSTVETGGTEQQALSRKICLACDQQWAGNMVACPHDGTVLVPLKVEDEFIGKVIADRYQIMSKLGKGGMGIVYLAKHQMMDRLVAVKMLQAELSHDELSVKRFVQEAKAASALNHPHIISLYDFGILPTGQPYLAMEYLEGVPLLDLIRKRGPISPQRAVKIFGEAADGLHHAHIAGIVHRDLKPSNIILVNHDNDPDFVKIVDFGLAKLMPWSGKESQHLTKTGEVFGSPIYMSPEQCMGKQLLPTSDIYSLGVTLFESLTGRPPFRGQNSIQTASKHMSEQPPIFEEVVPGLGVPPALEAVVLRALAKNPDDRFQNMAEMKDAMERALYAEPDLNSQPPLISQEMRSFTKSTVPSSVVPPYVSQKEIRPILQTVETPKLRPQPGWDKQKGGLTTPIKIAIGAVVVGALAAGAYVVNGLVTANQATPIQGVVYFYDPSAEIILHVGANSNQHLKLKAAIDGMEARYDRSWIGATFKGQYNKSDGTLEKVTEPPQVPGEDDLTATAYTMARDFMDGLTRGESSDRLLSSSAQKDWESLKSAYPPSAFKKDAAPSHKSVLGGGDDGEESQGAPSSAFKIADTADKQARILVDTAAYLKEPKGILEIVVTTRKPGDFQITSIKTVSRQVWEGI
jgi:serine/threonine protein kinase